MIAPFAIAREDAVPSRHDEQRQIPAPWLTSVASADRLSRKIHAAIRGRRTMATTNDVQVIAIEEHYNDSELSSLFEGRDARSIPHIVSRLDDLGELRLGEMDEGGIDVQVLSHAAPSTQKLDPETAVRVARNVNDRLKQTIDGNPERFQGFAALPTPDPKAAADELERCVDKLGFKGAMIHGLTKGGLFFDDKRFWPIFERAEALDVPLYMHPAIPHPDVIKAYYEDYMDDFPGLLTAGWGFTVETATQGIRLVISGVFDAHPGVNIILGHLGESIPFSLWRIDQALSRDGNRPSPGAVARRQPAVGVPRYVLRALLYHDQRQLLRSGAALLHPGDGRRPHPVLGRLPVRGQPSRRQVDGRAVAVGRGQGEDPQRQLQAAAQDVMDVGRRR
jgi:2,3-dihydroxybenzoate decarboxylase